jgi:hypothetical protein
MPVAIDLANRLPKNAIAHSGELNPMIFIELY